jgi:hypothetical protein
VKEIGAWRARNSQCIDHEILPLHKLLSDRVVTWHQFMEEAPIIINIDESSISNGFGIILHIC